MHKNITNLVLILVASMSLITGACYAALGIDHIGSSSEIADYFSPSTRFNQHNSMQSISAVLNKHGATEANKKMFEEMIQNEVAGFLGYHAASNDFRIFQDIIRVAIEEYLGITIRPDFQFLRVPDSPELNFESAHDFNAAYPLYDDQNNKIQAHLLSLNIALFYFWDFEYDFTPRYFLQNVSSNKPIFEEKLMPFFKQFGLGRKDIDNIFALAREFVPKNKGMILQLFDMSHENSTPYAFANTHAFEANRYSKAPHTKELSIYYLFPSEDSRSKKNKFWLPRLGQHGTNDPNSIRLLLSNKHALNPNSPLVILRYHNMNHEKEVEYELQLREYMRNLPFDQQLAEKYKERLINLWD